MYGLFRRVAKRKPILSKNMAAQLRFVKLHLNKSQDISNKTKVEMFAAHLGEVDAAVKVQTSTWLKCCGETLRKLCINDAANLN